MSEDQMYLWTFRVRDMVCIARGRTQSEAASFASLNWRHGNTLVCESHNPVEAGKLASKTELVWIGHAHEWPPKKGE